MEDQIKQFSKTLDRTHLDKALDLQEDLKKQKVAAADQKLLVTTTDIFLAGFKKFPQVADNEFVQD